MLVTTNTNNNLVVITLDLDQANCLHTLLKYYSFYGGDTIIPLEEKLIAELLPKLSNIPFSSIILKHYL